MITESEAFIADFDEPLYRPYAEWAEGSNKPEPPITGPMAAATKIVVGEYGAFVLDGKHIGPGLQTVPRWIAIARVKLGLAYHPNNPPVAPPARKPLQVVESEHGPAVACLVLLDPQCGFLSATLDRIVTGGEIVHLCFAEAAAEHRMGRVRMLSKPAPTGLVGVLSRLLPDRSSEDIRDAAAEINESVKSFTTPRDVPAGVQVRADNTRATRPRR